MSGCYLDIGPGVPGKSHALYARDQELDVFWNCEVYQCTARLWSSNGTSDGKLKLYTVHNNSIFYLEWDSRTGQGFDVLSDERNAKVDPIHTGDPISFDDRSGFIRMSAYDYTDRSMVLEMSDNWYQYKLADGKIVNGSEAKWDLNNVDNKKNEIVFENKCTSGLN